MNKLVIIGNGFDLAHGFKTRYSDFILWYLNNVYFEWKGKGVYGDKILQFRNYEDIDFNKFDSISNFIEVIERNTKVRPLYYTSFVKSIFNTISENNWVDIESQYYTYLTKIYRVIEDSKYEVSPEIISQLKKINGSFSHIKDNLEEYLSTIKISKENIKEEIKDHFDNITGYCKINKTRICFLNFNYTSTIDLYVDKNNSNISINNIHGRLNDIENPIVFGYGDELDTYYEKIERLNVNEFIVNIKSFSYFKTNNYQNLIRFIDGDEFEVIIMGHSCGISDRILLNSIFEHKNCKNIRIFYYQKTKNSNDYFEKTQEISRHFKAEFKGKMRKIITPFSESDPLIRISK